eukprot:437417_1
MLVVPLFNTMMTICSKRKTKRCAGGEMLYLWDIRNNVMAIDYVQRTVKCEMLYKHVTVKITRDELVELVLKAFEDDILDDDTGIKRNSQLYDAHSVVPLPSALESDSKAFLQSKIKKK